jgi:hypothetical protein
MRLDIIWLGRRNRNSNSGLKKCASEQERIKN